MRLRTAFSSAMYGARIRAHSSRKINSISAYMLLDMLWGMVGAALPNYLWHQINNGVRSIPQLVVGGLILVIGIKLILGKKREGGDA